MAVEQFRVQLLPRLAIAEGATTPNPGANGVWIWSTTTSHPMMWNGTAWHSGANIHVGTTAPTNPVTGDLWVDTT